MFPSILDKSPDSIVWLQSGIIRFLNENFVTLLGADDRPQLQGCFISEFVHPDFREIAAGRLAKAAIDQVAEFLDMKFVRLDGSEIWVETTGCLVEFDGETFVQGVIRDITFRKTLEHDLAASRERYDLASRGANVVIWDWDVTSNTLYRSEQVKESLGINHVSGFISVEDFVSHVHPDDFAIVRKSMTAHFKGEADRYECEYRIRDSNGDYRWVLDSGIGVRNEEGEVVRVAGSAIDITEKRIALGERDGLQNRLLALAELGSDFFWEMDAELRFTKFFGSVSSGANKNALGKKRWESATEEDLVDHKKWSEHRAQLDSGLAFRNFEFEMSSDPPMWVSVSGEPLFDENKKFIGYFGTTTDITRQKNNELRILESEDRYRTLVEGAVLGVIVHADDRVLYVNEAVSKLLGYSTDELYALKSLSQLFTEESRDRHNSYQNARLRGEKVPESYETDWVQKDGKIISIQQLSQIVEWQGKRAIQATVTDVTDRNTAMDNLVQSQIRFKSFAEIGSDWFFEMDKDLRYTYVSDSIVEMRKQNPDNFLGRTHEESMSKFMRDTGQQDFVNATTRRELIKDMSLCRILPDGESVWARVSATPLFDEDNNFRGYRGSGTDVTPQKEAEKKLEEAIESFSSGFALYDKDDRLVLFNSHHQKSVEANAPGTLKVGRTFEEMLNDWASAGAFNISGETRAEYVAKRLENRRQTPTQFESQLNDGQWVLISEYRMSSGGTAVVVTDISERRQTEESLRASEERLTEILDLAPEAVITIDHDMRIQVFNKGAERIFGYNADEVVGRSMDFLMPKSARSNHTKHIKSFNQSSEVYRLMDKRAEVAGLRKDGTEFPASASVSKLETADGRLYTVMLQDVSDRRQVEEERHTARNEAEIANRANLAKSEFLSSMSHELRTPLNSILGFSQLLEFDLEDPLNEDQQDNVSQILKNGRHLLELVNDVLDLAEIEANEAKLGFEDVSTAEVIDECLEPMSILADERGIDVSFINTDANKLLIRADKRRLRQVILNLLSNAIKYNDENGELTIVVEETGESKLRIAVSDTGEGIPENKLNRLFKPFSRLDAENTEIEGTGIGLVVCKNLIELMNGTIGVESEVGRGSTFWFELPLAKANRIEADKKSEDELNYQVDLPLKLNGTLLYVEDNLANLRLVEKIISRIDGLTMISAPNAEIGMTMAQCERPDLILMDINLPGVDGVAATKVLGKLRETSDIPIVAISAAATVDDIEFGMSGGFEAYLTKPVDVPELIEVIKTVIGSKRSAY